MNGDGTVLFFTPKGRVLVNAPKRPVAARLSARKKMAARSTEPGDGLAGQSASGLPPVPSHHPGAPAKGDGFALSNGAALYRDSEIPWAIEAAARGAMDESPD